MSHDRKSILQRIFTDSQNPINKLYELTTNDNRNQTKEQLNVITDDIKQTLRQTPAHRATYTLERISKITCDIFYTEQKYRLVEQCSPAFYIIPIYYPKTNSHDQIPIEDNLKATVAAASLLGFHTHFYFYVLDNYNSPNQTWHAHKEIIIIDVNGYGFACFINKDKLFIRQTEKYHVGIGPVIVATLPLADPAAFDDFRQEILDIYHNSYPYYHRNEV